jgi:subtilisin family serine protease
VFRNPDSSHNDRELPDLAANGTSVSATGQTKSGTSFASPAVAGTAAVIQSVDGTLKTWPEGCRAILLASAGRNISGGSWSQAATSSTTDGVDGSGALDTGEAARIARVRSRRGSNTAVRRGWDVGMLQTSDLQSAGTTRTRYKVQIPASGARRLKAALAWSSKVKYTSDTTLTPPVKVTESKLTVDLDLYIYQAGSSVLQAQSSTFDNSFEIIEFDAQPGRTYEIAIKRFSGTDWAWFGIAWTVV